MKRLFRWVVVACIVLLLILFPRGTTPVPGHSHVERATFVFFTWAHLSSNVLSWCQQLLHLSLGRAFDQIPVTQEVASHFLSSAGLILVAAVMVLLFGVTKGVYDGLRTSSPTVGSRISSVIQGVCETLPDFFIANILIMISFLLLQHGIKVYIVGSSGFFLGTFVPSLILAAVPTMYMARMVRMNVEEQFGQQYLVTAESKGILKSRIVIRHLVPNVFPVVLTSFVPVLAMLFSNLFVVEHLFFKVGIVSGLTQAMGISGSDPMYMPLGGDKKFQYFSYNAFDANLTVAYILACLLFITLCWLVVRLLLSLFGYRGYSNPYTSQLREASRRGRGTWSITIGVGMLLLLVLLGIFQAHLSLPNPDYREQIHFGANGQMSAPPFPPSLDHLFGTDIHGRDLLSRSIRGILPTFEYLALVTCTTLLVSTVLAALSSIWNIRFIRSVINVWYSLFTVIPGLIAVILIMDIPDIYWFGFHHDSMGVSWYTDHLCLYLGVLCAIETGRVSHHLQFILDESSQKSYMEAAEIAGNTAWGKLIIHHLYPLRAAVLEQGTICFNRTLMLIAVLGFFYHPLNQAWIFRWDFWEYSVTSADWGSLIAENGRDYLSYNYVLFAPIVFVTYTIISTSLIGRGLRNLSESVPKQKGLQRTRLSRFILVSRSRSTQPDTESAM